MSGNRFGERPLGERLVLPELEQYSRPRLVGTRPQEIDLLLDIGVDVCRVGSLLHTSPKIGTKPREECELATGQTRGGRCNRCQERDCETRIGLDHRRT